MKTKFGLIVGLGQTVKAKKRKEGKRKKKRKKREEPRKVRISMIFDFEYGIICILDFGRDFFMGSKPRV